jgi:hypothetical protein
MAAHAAGWGQAGLTVVCDVATQVRTCMRSYLSIVACAGGFLDLLKLYMHLLNSS